MLEQIASGAATQLFYIERSCFKKEVTGEIFRNFDLGERRRIEIPIYVIMKLVKKHQLN